jgi:hypothetical protein
VPDFPTVRRRRRLGGRAGALVAVVAVLVVAGVVVGTLKLTQGSRTSPAAATASATRASTPSSFVAAASGRNYAPATVASGVRDLLGLASARSPARPAGPTPAALKPLRTSERLFACVHELAGPSRPNVVPLAIDLAHWQGSPAAVIALPSSTHPGAADVFVVGPGCTDKPGEDHVRYYRRVPLARSARR